MGRDSRARARRQRRPPAYGEAFGLGGHSAHRAVRDQEDAPARRADVAREVAALWRELCHGDVSVRAAAAAWGARLAAHPAPVVESAAERFLRDAVAGAWRNGWQPAELHRQVRRRARTTGARLVEIAIHADHDGRAGQAIDERWAGQVRGLGQRTASTSPGWLGRWCTAEGLERAEAYAVAGAVWRAAARLPAVETLLPPPGAPERVTSFARPSTAGGTDPMLGRIRKLLAKAEATDFEQEAAAFTAKAQELMTQHAIDAALVAAGGEAESGPRMIRMPVDAPYADAKAVLLGVVADANRCRSVGLSGLDLSTVVGHAEDLDAVEMLFTSLLVQAQNALAAAGRGAGGRARSVSFRSSFFLAFASRIGDRLAVATADTAAGAGAGALPVLRSREAATEELFDELFGGSLTQSRVRGGYDGAGLLQGQQAADRARLDSGRLTARAD